MILWNIYNGWTLHLAFSPSSIYFTCTAWRRYGVTVEWNDLKVILVCMHLSRSLTSKFISYLFQQTNVGIINKNTTEWQWNMYHIISSSFSNRVHLESFIVRLVHEEAADKIWRFKELCTVFKWLKVLFLLQPIKLISLTFDSVNTKVTLSVYSPSPRNKVSCWL